MNLAATFLRSAPFAALLVFAGVCDAGTATTTTPAPAQQQNNNAAVAAEMMIESGRLGVMLDQADAAMRLGAGEPSEDALVTPAQQQTYAVHALRAAVLRYNMMQFDACRSGFVTGDLCGPPYLPEWLKDPPDTIPQPAVVAARVQETLGRIMPFWKALCAKAIAQTHDETFCQIE